MLHSIKATVRISPAARPGQTPASTCALALAAQAADVASPLRQRIASLVGARVLHDSSRAAGAEMPLGIADDAPTLQTGAGGAALQQGGGSDSRRQRQWVTFDESAILAHDATQSKARREASAAPEPPAGLVGTSLALPAAVKAAGAAGVDSGGEGGGGWEHTLKLQGQQQVLKGPPHAPRQFPRGWSPYECTCGTGWIHLPSLHMGLAGPWLLSVGLRAHLPTCDNTSDCPQPLALAAPWGFLPFSLLVPTMIMPLHVTCALPLFASRPTEFCCCSLPMDRLRHPAGTG